MHEYVLWMNRRFDKLYDIKKLFKKKKTENYINLDTKIDSIYKIHKYY